MQTLAKCWPHPLPLARWSNSVRNRKPTFSTWPLFQSTAEGYAKTDEATKKDHELLTHEPKIPLLYLHLHQLLKDINESGGAEAFERVKGLWIEFRKVRTENDAVKKKTKYLDRIDDVIMNQDTHYQA